MVQVDFPAYALSMHKQNALRITYKGQRPLALYSHLVGINVFAKSDEISSLPVQVIKENSKCRRLRNTKGNDSNRTGP